MEIVSTLLALCEGNPPVTDGFPSQRPVTRSFDVFFDLHLNKLLSKQLRRRRFEMPSRLLWCHYDVVYIVKIGFAARLIIFFRVSWFTESPFLILTRSQSLHQNRLHMAYMAYGIYNSLSHLWSPWLVKDGKEAAVFHTPQMFSKSINFCEWWVLDKGS